MNNDHISGMRALQALKEAQNYKILPMAVVSAVGHKAAFLFAEITDLASYFAGQGALIEHDGESWFYRSDADLMARTLLSAAELKSAKKKLKESGLVRCKTLAHPEGGSVCHYTLDMDEIAKLATGSVWSKSPDQKIRSGQNRQTEGFIPLLKEEQTYVKKSDPEVQMAWDFYLKVFSRSKGFKLTDKRKSKIKKFLKDHGLDTFKRCCVGNKLSEYHQTNGYNDIQHVTKDTMVIPFSKACKQKFGAMIPDPVTFSAPKEQKAASRAEAEKIRAANTAKMLERRRQQFGIKAPVGTGGPQMPQESTNTTTAASDTVEIGFADSEPTESLYG